MHRTKRLNLISVKHFIICLTTHTSIEISNELQKILKNISNASIQSYLIKKTRKKNQFEKFTTHRFQITDKMAQEYRTLFETSMKEHNFSNKKTSKIKRFTDPSLIESNECYFIEKNTLQELDGLIQDLEMHNDSSPIQELNNMEKAHIYCIEITVDGNIIFAFASVDNMYIKDTQKHILAEFKKDKIDKITKNLIQFSKNIDCMYLVNTQSLIIMNHKNTSNILSFSDQFRKKAKEIIQKKWTVVDISVDSMDKVLKNNTYNEALIKLDKSGRLNNDLKHYQNYNSFCNKQQTLDLELLSIHHDKVIANKSKDLEIAIYVSDNSIVEGVLIPGEFSWALRRKQIEKK